MHAGPLPEAGLILNHFPEINTEQQRRFVALPALYAVWNARLNLVSRRDLEHLAERHVLHSLAIAKAFPFAAGMHVLDAGTGGGFPGIPLAILRPDCRFTLADSVAKKIRAVQAIALELGLDNVRAVASRVEDLPDAFDAVVSRATAPVKDLVRWTSKLLAPEPYGAASGLICLKGGDLAAELGSYAEQAVVRDVADYFEGEYFKEKKIVFLPTAAMRSRR